MDFLFRPLLVLKFLSISAISSIVQESDSVWSPCNFPTPATATDYEQRCTRYLELPYICDIDQVLSRTGSAAIDQLVSKEFGQIFSLDITDVKGACGIAIAILKQIVVPDSVILRSSSSTSSKNFYCIFGQSVGAVNEERVWNRTDLRDYIQLFGHIVRRRWFSNDCGQHLLILASTEGAVSLNRSTRLISRPVVELAWGSGLVDVLGLEKTNELKADAESYLNKGWHISGTISKTLRSLADQLLQAKQSGTKRYHKGVPDWAKRSFVGCLSLAFFAVGLDYLVVRKKGLSMGKISGGAPAAPKAAGGRTHLMF